MRRAGYFIRQQWSLNDRDSYGDLRLGREMLVELTPQELRTIERTHGPALVTYKRVDGLSAHDWVRRGYTHETGLYLDDGRIRYAESDLVE